MKRLLPVIAIAGFLFLGTAGAAALPAPDSGQAENILIFWTDGGSLKAATLMCVRSPREPIGIVAIPVEVRVKDRFAGGTVAEAYGELGRQGLTKCLADLFQVKIDSYFTIDQSTLDKTSQVIGPVLMEGNITTLSDVFEGTYIDEAIDPQVEIRHLAERMTEPSVIVKVPQLVWIISSEVQTNLGLHSLISIYRAVEEQGPGILNKKALPWYEYYVNGCRYRVVPQDKWAQVLQSVISG